MEGTIIDSEGKTREVEEMKLINLEGHDFVKVLIIGKTREWDQYYPLAEFKENNPMWFDGLGRLVERQEINYGI